MGPTRDQRSLHLNASSISTNLKQSETGALLRCHLQPKNGPPWNLCFVPLFSVAVCSAGVSVHLAPVLCVLPPALRNGTGKFAITWRGQDQHWTRTELAAEPGMFLYMPPGVQHAGLTDSGSLICPKQIGLWTMWSTFSIPRYSNYFQLTLFFQ